MVEEVLSRATIWMAETSEVAKTKLRINALDEVGRHAPVLVFSDYYTSSGMTVMKNSPLPARLEALGLSSSCWCTTFPRGLSAAGRSVLQVSSSQPPQLPDTASHSRQSHLQQPIPFENNGF